MKSILWQRNWVSVQETHTAPTARWHRGAHQRTAKNFWRPPENAKNFWSHGSSQEQGIGLIIEHDFLNKSDDIHQRSRIEVTPGRAAKFELRGPLGNVDVWAIYRSSGSQSAERQRELQKIEQATVEPKKTVTIMAGVFNFATHTSDRWNGGRKEWIGNGNVQEPQTWSEIMDNWKGLKEIFQQAMTHRHTNARSRLDRFYANHHIADQLHSNFVAAADKWDDGLSNHRPVRFGRWDNGESDTPKIS